MSALALLRLVSAAAAAAALCAPPQARGDSVRCAGGLVATGDSKLDLLGKCGSPAVADGAAVESTTAQASDGAARRVSAPVEIWTYDLGKSRFTQVVRIVRGKVASIERGSYGYAEAEPPPVRARRSLCDPATLAAGKLELDVLARCGEPAVVDTWREEVAVGPAGDGSVAVAVGRTVQLLTYDFGPDQLVRYVQIEDGKVTRVESGSHGYAR